MPVNVNQPRQRDDESILDVIGKAVNIATTVYGIKIKSDELGLAQEERTRKMEGKVTPVEQAEIASKLVPGQEGEAGAVRLQPTTGGAPLYYKPKPVKVEKELPTKPGEKAVDVSFAKDYADYVAAGGSATIDRHLKLLESAKDQLLTGEGGTSGKLVGVADAVGLLPFTASKSQALKEDVETAVQGSMKQVLGTQFTEKEGRAILKRAYNPALPPDENVKKLDSIIEEIKSGRAAKEKAIEYYEANGSLKGFKGGGPAKAAPKAPKMDASKLSDEELDKALGY